MARLHFEGLSAARPEDSEAGADNVWNGFPYSHPYRDALLEQDGRRQGADFDGLFGEQGPDNPPGASAPADLRVPILTDLTAVDPDRVHELGAIPYSMPRQEPLTPDEIARRVIQALNEGEPT